MSKQKVKASKGKGEKSAEIADLKDKLARLFADYDNARKRFEGERLELENYYKGSIVLKLIPALEMLEKAQSHLNDEGLELALKVFTETLKSEGFEKVTASEGDDFDESLHEAIDIVPGGEEGQIAEVVQPGWQRVDGQVLRHTKVKVYKN